MEKSNSVIVLRFSPGVIVVYPNNETLRAVNRPFLFIYKENIRAIHVCAAIAAQTHHHNVNRKSPWIEKKYSSIFEVTILLYVIVCTVVEKGYKKENEIADIAI